MSAEWEEVKRLAADFQRAQLGTTVQRLSERNCIEIVKKLTELELIDVIFTNDGKEYLTPTRVLKELKDELYVHNGRLNLVDAAQIIGIDLKHVETKAEEIVSSEPGVQFILGQLITRDYLDHLGEEVNDKLAEDGQVTISELSKVYDLPGEFLEEAIRTRLGTIIQGQADCIDKGTICTEEFIAENTARIRGALSAITQPIPVHNIITHFKFPHTLFYNVAEELIKEGRICGVFTGGHSERSIFIPDIYARSQNKWIDSFYRQNGYLEYDALTRLGIQDTKSFIKKKLKDENVIYLTTCCVGEGILNQVEAAIEEALNSGSWVDTMPVLPSVFSVEDCHEIVTAVVKKISSRSSLVHVYCDTTIVSENFIMACKNSFEAMMATKAQEDVIKKAHLFAAAQQKKSTAFKKEENKGKQEKKDEKKKKPTVGKSGGGTQGRETKTKAVKKKYFTGKVAEESSDEEDSTSAKDTKLELEFLEPTGIEKNLKTLDLCMDCPEDFISELAAQIHRPLTKRYQEVVQSAYASCSATSGESRRKQHSDYQEKFTNHLNLIIMFEKGTKVFSDDVGSQLTKYLLKTLCTEMVNMIVNYLAQEHGISPGLESEATMSTENRLKVINQFADDIKQPVTKLHNSLNAKTLEDFYSTVETALGPGICDMVIRKPDKKKERSILLNHRQSLLAQLSESSEPALCLHLAVLVIFQSQTQSMLHASGKFVPHVIGFLQKQVPSDVHQLLTIYQEAVIKKLTSSENDEETQKTQAILYDEMSNIKETAITYKKTSVSEAEN